MHQLTPAGDIPAPPAPGPDIKGEGLRGRMGVPSIVFMVLACMSPLTGAAGYAALVVAGGNGLGAPFMFLLVGLTVLVFAVGYVGLVRRIARPGAFYAYVTAGLGRRIGLGGAFLTILTYLLAEIGLITFGGISLGGFISEALGGPVVDWWLCAIPFLVVAAILSYFNVAVSARFLGAILIAELAIVLVFDLVVALRGGPEGISVDSFSVSALTSGSLPLAFLFCLTLFSGWESTALYYEEIRDPQRNIARATYAVVGIVATLYVVTTWMLITSFGSTNAVEAIGADYSAAFGTAVTNYLGAAVNDVVNVFLITGILASVLSMNNMLSRYVYSLGVDGVFPASLGKANRRHGSPARASVLISAILVCALAVIVLTGADANSVLALSSGSGTYGFLFMFLVATVATLVYFLRNPERTRPGRIATFVFPAVAGAIFAVMLVYVAVNLDLIVGDQPALTLALQIAVYASFGAGVLYASYLAVARNHVFEKIGRQEIGPEVDPMDH